MPRRAPNKSPHRMPKLLDTRTLQLTLKKQNNGIVTRLLPLHFNPIKNTRHSVSIWRRTRVRRNSQLSTSSKAGASEAAKTGRVGIIGPSGITDLLGTIKAGGGAITTTA